MHELGIVFHIANQVQDVAKEIPELNRKLIIQRRLEPLIHKQKKILIN